MTGTENTQKGPPGERHNEEAVAPVGRGGAGSTSVTKAQEEHPHRGVQRKETGGSPTLSTGAFVWMESPLSYVNVHLTERA